MPETALAGAPDRFEKEDLAIHEARRRAFLKIAEAEPLRCRVLDAGGTPEDVAADVWRAVDGALRARQLKVGSDG
nr:hypothetical protein [Marinicella sp. W31]MDC2877049.1 hypothetical protein [Marinicella sp. W31]